MVTATSAHSETLSLRRIAVAIFAKIVLCFTCVCLCVHSLEMFAGGVLQAGFVCALRPLRCRVGCMCRFEARSRCLARSTGTIIVGSHKRVPQSHTWAKLILYEMCYSAPIVNAFLFFFLRVCPSSSTYFSVRSLIQSQAEAGISAPVGLDPRLSGLVESWADGYADWGQLCASTR